MKHTLQVTLLLVGLFVLAQVIGLFIIDGYLGQEEIVVDGEVMVNTTWSALPYGVERPDLDEDTSYLPLMGIILVATLLILLLMKLKLVKLWIVWFFISVWFCLAVAFHVVFIDKVAVALAAVFALGKVWWKNMYLHNFTEMFIYGGLAAVFVPFLNVFSVMVLLVLISVYDFIAVWKTKHMVSMAQFQTKMKLFAGLLVPYGKKKYAVLGGGDIGFPLFFAGVVLKQSGWFDGLLVVFAVTLALVVLLMKSKKNTFYPAMPFLTAGCFLGLILTLI
jgi:presenilin-like A22 family membrane protease